MNTKRFLLALIVLAAASMTSAMALTVDNLRVQTMRCPSGIDQQDPWFSWQLQSAERGIVQESYRLVITSDADGADVVFDSGTVPSRQSVGVVARGATLQPATRYYWHVTVADNHGSEATSTETAFFDTGLMSSGWGGAQWIRASNLKPGETADEPTDYTVEGRIQIEHTAAGLCFAMQDASNFYYWQLNTEGDYPRLRPHVWQNGNPACLANIDLRGKAELNNTDWFTLRIEVTGASRARTFINDVLVDDRTGNFRFGRVGMREDHGERDGQPEIGCYDDIRVTTADGTVLFSDDFSGDNHFTGGSITDGGYLRVVGSTSGHRLVWQKSKDGNYVHYRLDYDMHLVRASAAMIFAATSGNTYHMWQINCNDNANPSVRHHTYVNGNLTWNDAQFTQFSKADLLGHTRHYTVDVENGVIRTYVDGTLVDTFTDPTGTAVAGDIGMRVDNNALEEAYYDNIVVTEYEADGSHSVTLSEDFEGLSSDFFITAEVENFDGSRMCHVKSPSGEKKVMQSTTNDGVPVFRKQFVLAKHVSHATLFTAALGVYDLYLNGERVGHVQPDGQTLYEELKPGWSDFRRRAFYSTHDVTALLAEGSNALSAVVASGWYSGGIAHGLYGTDDQLSLLAKLVITYDDGTTETVVTDPTWRSSKRQGLRYSDMYNGEVYDARLESDWRAATYDDSDWSSVVAATYGGLVETFQGPWVQVLTHQIQSVRKATVYEGATPQGSDYGMVNVVKTVEGAEPLTLKPGQTVIFDFGQNVVGRYRFTVRGQAGTRLHLQCSEMLNDNGQRSRGNDGPGGSLYLVNLRSARAETYYTLCGATEGEEWAPMTTFYGFRYVAMTTTAEVTVDQITAEPLSSSTDETGDIATSHPMVNQLISNIVWGQRGNLLSVPTDCPQRDERQGWTADTQVYSRTGMYFANLETFYRKWMQDMRDGQRDDGAFPDTAPIGYAGFGGSAWSDAGILVPWYVYALYGDKTVLLENFEAMERYMDWLARQTGEGYLYNGALTTYGDWLAYQTTDNRYVSVAYYAYDAQLMAKTCRALSESEDDSYAQKAAKYEELFQNIKAEFRSRYIKPTVRQNTQTAVLMAMEYNLLDGQSEIDNFISRITRLIRSNGYKLSTGFLGTAIINCTLSRFGQGDYAYDLLLQRQNPSWLYPIDQGATTMWERWNSYTLESGFGDPGMNSFNHYAYGAVGEWMFRHMLGIDYDELEPGFSHIILQPQPDRRTTLPDGQELITWARGHHQSYYGDIRSSWQTTGANGDLVYECSVPANTTATLRLPVGDAATVVYEGGLPADQAEGVDYIGYEDGCQVYHLGSGTYRFTTSLASAVSRPAADGASAAQPVYDLSGRRVQTLAASSQSLHKGLYVTRGKKVVLK